MGRAGLLLVNVFVVATCGLVYELLAGTLASYLYGNAVVEFSLVIGLYLAALGVGAWLSRLLVKDLARRFVEVELAVALVGGLSAPLLLFGFGHVAVFRILLDVDLFIIGVLVGIELPLLMRLLKEELAFKEVVARALALDYAGALVASILFPLVLVPTLGLVRTSALFGLLNAAVALGGTWLLAPLLRRAPGVSTLRAGSALVIVALGIVLFDEGAFAFLASD
jgi:spermidine synthase